MGRWGDVFGLGFGVEAWAFFLEAVLIAIYLYGWRRLKPWTHFWLGLPLPLAALMGAFGIIAANSWMNTPQGFTLDAQGNPVDVDVRQAIFTPMFGPEYWHFVVAMLLTAGYVVAGVYAVGWLRGRRDRYHRLGFTVPFTVAAILTPVQFMLGDSARPRRLPQAAGQVRRHGDRLEDRHPRAGVPVRPAASATGRSPAASRSPSWTRSSPASARTPR